jgi:hypothetical protein
MTDHEMIKLPTTIKNWVLVKYAITSFHSHLVRFRPESSQQYIAQSAALAYNHCRPISEQCRINTKEIRFTPTYCHQCHSVFYRKIEA